MIIEVCNLCKKPVCDLTKTEVIIKDYNGLSFDCYGGVFPARRKFRGVICDKCLAALRGSNEEE